MLYSIIGTLYLSAASSPAIAAENFSLAHDSAERAFEEVSTAVTWGRLACIQRRHWPSDCGWAKSFLICDLRQLPSKQCWIGSTICATILSSLSTNISSVWVTTPSVEFSTGTTP